MTLAVTALAVSACGGGGGGSATPQNAAPTISPLSAVMTNQDTPTNAIAFTIGDDGGVGALTVSAMSQNPDIVPDSGLALSGTGANRTITVTPVPDATGNAVITITVADAQGLTAQLGFGVNVVAVNRSFADLANSTFAVDANGTPTQVNGFTFTQDADAVGSFDPLLQ
jgi:hypothetical protein